MRNSILFPSRLLQAYSIFCAPFCKQIGINHTSFDILMFLANNPEYDTAADVVRVRGIKANLVSIHVDKLVTEGYLLRIPDTRDRRKVHLHCSEKAAPILAEGCRLQERFVQQLFSGIDPADQERFQRTFAAIDRNLDSILSPHS